MVDTYVYPGTNVLKNRLGIRDADAFEDFEMAAMLQRMREGLPKIDMTAEGFCLIHKHLFQDVFDWAGQYRTVQIAKSQSFFCRAEFIASAMQQLFAQMATQSFGKNLSNIHFAAWMAHYCTEINAIHPFREGNGRTLRTFLEILAKEADHTLDLTLIKAEPWLNASIVGFHKGDNNPMMEVILGALKN